MYIFAVFAYIRREGESEKIDLGRVTLYPRSEPFTAVR